MDISAINARLAELDVMEKQAQQAFNEAQANLNAISGAKQDCQWWLVKLGQKPAKVKKQKKAAGIKVAGTDTKDAGTAQ